MNTEGAKNALAKIAASTIAGHDHGPGGTAGEGAGRPPASLDQLATVLPEGPRGADKH